jgi:hypothetical protein
MRYLRRNKVNQRRHSRIPGLVDHLAWFNSDKIYTISPALVLAEPCRYIPAKEGISGEARESTVVELPERPDHSRGGGINL